MVGTILLTQDNKYTNKDGNIPSRPFFDKELLGVLCKSGSVSNKGYALLPPSLKKVTLPSTNFDIPITIRELAEADILIVVRSVELVGAMGKEFRLDKHKLIIKQRAIEIWGLKDEFR